MTTEIPVTEHPLYPAYRHARRLIVAAGMGQALACLQAKISERDYQALDRLYRQLPPVRHSNSRPHEDYGDAEPPPCLAGLVRTTRKPAPLPADWAPPSRPQRRCTPVEEEMGKSRGRPPWRRGDPDVDPAAELRELETDEPAEQEEPDFEDLAAIENTEEEQAAMSRGEWDEQDSVEEFAEAAGRTALRDPYHSFEVKSVPEQEQAAIEEFENGHEREPWPALTPEFSIRPEPESPCGSAVHEQGVWYVCRSSKHSPLVAHDYVQLRKDDSGVLDQVSKDQAAHVSLINPIDLPHHDPDPTPPSPDEVEEQKQKGIEALDQKLERDSREFKRWKRQELPGYLELVSQGYDPEHSVHFKRLTPAQLQAVKSAAGH